MGMYDDVTVFMSCPKCGEFSQWGFQTKSLESCLFQYRPLSEDWFTRKETDIDGHAARSRLPVFPTVPYDKEPSCWQNQAERAEIKAMPSAELANQLKYIEVHGRCPKCAVFIRGKLAIKGGYLVKPVYGIEADD